MEELCESDFLEETVGIGGRKQGEGVTGPGVPKIFLGGGVSVPG
jgi:hypothetical protein